MIWVTFNPWAVYCECLSSFIWKEGEGQTQIEEHFPEALAWGVFIRRFQPEEFSSAGDFGLRSFGHLAISTWAEISDISGRELRIFQRGTGRGGKGRGGVNGFKYCLVKVKWRSSRGTCAVCHPEILFPNKQAEHIDFQLFYVDDFGSLIPTFSVNLKINTHSGDCVLGACTPMVIAYFHSWGESEYTKTNSTARTMAKNIAQNIINLSSISTYHRKKCILSNFTWARVKIQSKWVVFPRKEIDRHGFYHIPCNRRVSGSRRPLHFILSSLWPTQCRLETQVEGAEHVSFFM